MAGNDKELLAEKPVVWSLYIVRMANGNFYTGIATDVARRFGEHEASGAKSARALRGKGPLTLMFQREVGNRSEAQSAEYRVKQLAKVEKLALVQQQPEVLERCFPVP